MKNTGLQLIALLILVVLLLMNYREFSAQREFRADINARMDRIEEGFAQVEMQMDAQRNKMQALEENSLGGIVENTGRALSDGWQVMMKTIEGELEKAEALAKEQREAWEQAQREREQQAAKEREQKQAQEKAREQGEQF